MFIKNLDEIKIFTRLTRPTLPAIERRLIQLTFFTVMNIPMSNTACDDA